MRWIKKLIKLNFPAFIYRNKTSLLQKKRLLDWVNQSGMEPLKSIADSSFDIFTYHGEDGIINYLLHKMHDVPGFFVDIGSGDCVTSNCAALAVHFGWNGLFIDQQEKQLQLGKAFYSSITRTPTGLQFSSGMVTPDNIEDLLRRETIPSDIGLLSIDIDGNDYWVWKAITYLRPRIVVIEAKVEFGLRNLVVPYGVHNHHSVDKRYNGASVEALRLLGKKKGYKLVGANKAGYNLFFVQEKELLPEVDSEYVLQDPAIKQSFYPESFFASHTFAD